VYLRYDPFQLAFTPSYMLHANKHTPGRRHGHLNDVGNNTRVESQINTGVVTRSLVGRNRLKKSMPRRQFEDVPTSTKHTHTYQNPLHA